MRDRARPAVLCIVAILVATSALATLGSLPARAELGDDPDSGPWAEDGSVFRDRVRQSADDPDADPVDWYRVNLTAGATELDLLTLRVNMTRNGSDQLFVWASIHDPDGALLQEVKATSYAIKTTSALCHRTGVYLVRVYTYSYYDCNYLIEFGITKRANVTDGDDNLRDATFLDPPAEVTGHLHGVFDYFDHYAVNLTRYPDHYEFVEVRLEPDGIPPGRIDLDLFLILVDEEGVPSYAASSTTNASREVAFYAATVKNETVYIRCHAYGGDTDYRLNVTKYKVLDDGNNNILRADELVNGSSREDSLELTDRLDYFKVNLTGGDILWVTVTAHDFNETVRKPDLNIYLLDPNGLIINWSHSYDPVERVGWEHPIGDPPSWYYVLVRFFDRTPNDEVPAWGNYTINITVDHAPRILPDLPITVEEDTVLTSALGAFVEDPEGALVSVEVRGSDNVSVTLSDGELYLRGAANFSGMATFTLAATDAHRTVHLTVPVNVTPVPDAPAAVHPLPVIELEEDQTLDVDLGELIVDGDGDVLEFVARWDPNGSLGGSSIEGSTLTVVPDVDFFGDAGLIVEAWDGTGLRTEVVLPVSVQPLPDDPVVLLADPTLTALEDQMGVGFDLTDLFWDPDGEVLSYSIEPAEHVSFIVVGDVLVVDPEADFDGTVELSITATDGTGASASAVLRLTFLPVNDPPVIGSIHPEGTISLTEGDALIFGVNATDPERQGLDHLWYVDTVLVPDEGLSRYEYVTDFDSQGTHLVSVGISDGERTTWVNWSVTVENVNRPPTLSIERPRADATYDEGNNVVFEAQVLDPDGEATSVQWLMGEEVIGTGYAFTTSSLKAGRHTVTARATDPYGAAVQANVTFTVEERGGLPGACGPLVAFAVLVGGAMAAAWRRSRRG